ncbi:hypothetical protein KK099_04260 [Curtobacterium flaccumfaciens pv. flaccumfaciens]|nr:hypothetical protein [Curtobacterium flaccumfaciens pv. flaccumfaciens]
MRVLFIGAGSVGGLFGSLLLDAGVDVSFLVRPNRRTQLQQAGLAIASAPDGPVRRLAVRSVTRDEVSSSDVVVFAVRSPELGAAIDDSQASVGPTTTVLPLLNGMRHPASLSERFGNRVLGGLAVTGTVLDADHIIRRLGNEASITFGELDGRSSVRTNDIAALFKPAAFRTVLSPTSRRTCGRSGFSWRRAALSRSCWAAPSARWSPPLTVSGRSKPSLRRPARWQRALATRCGRRRSIAFG